MLNKIISAAFVALITCSTESIAGMSFGTSLERYHWQEYTNNGPFFPTEAGNRYAINLNWVQDAEKGLLYGYRGRFYTGRVHYDTYYQMSHMPVSTNTSYSGGSHEGQLYYRTNMMGLKLDFVGGLGLDAWQRSIANGDMQQIEDYMILFVRGGINLDHPFNGAGFHGGGGLKYPVWAAENAHLQKRGYYSNPTIHPGKATSPYAEIGYRINQDWDIVGYYDSWRFKQSDAVITANSSGTWLIWQPKSNMDAYGIRAMFSF